MAINIHIINSTGNLDRYLNDIRSAFRVSKQSATKLLKLDDIDVIVRNNASFAIKELGVGGFSDSINNVIYISLDTSNKIKIESIISCMHHEFYHVKRHLVVGLPKQLGERTIDEGLACLYEYEMTGLMPIYCNNKLDDNIIAKWSKNIRETVHTDKWFFGGPRMTRWIAYTIGFRLVKKYSAMTNSSSIELIKTKPELLIGQSVLLKNLNV